MQRYLIAILLFLVSVSAMAAEPTISGTVSDSLGAVVSGATVTLLKGDKPVDSTTSDSSGRFQFKIDESGRYSVRAEAKTFASSSSKEVFVEPQHMVDLSLTLSPSAVSENIVVTATGIATPEAQMGTSISVIESTNLGTRVDMQQSLQNEVGGQVVQSGQMGSTSSFFVRGGPSDANKVLLDGVPINDIGGGMNLSYLQADGFDRVEFQRGPNSALYGSDALASVVSITTQRGSTPLPLFSYAADGGTFGTYHQDGSVGGYWKRLDYFCRSLAFCTNTIFITATSTSPGFTHSWKLWLDITPEHHAAARSRYWFQLHAGDGYHAASSQQPIQYVVWATLDNQAHHLARGTTFCAMAACGSLPGSMMVYRHSV